jgi:O-antigen/teichoic acid export membrane protein
MNRRVARNVAWNVTGNLASLAVGLVALPVLLHALGAARLGVFTLALGLIGFSGLLDLGLGRSLTQTVSSRLGSGRPREAVAALAWHVLPLLGMFGVLWTLVLWWSVPWIVAHLFDLYGPLSAETVFGLHAVALSMPFALMSTGAMGTLEGLQEFRRVGSQRAALSIAQFGLPALAALWQPDVGWAISALAASRVLSAAVWLYGLARVLPRSPSQRYAKEDLNHLLRFGGWLSVSNLVGPLMVWADRFYLASVFPPATVAYYTVPYDSLFRLTALPATAMGALFPAFAESQAEAARVRPMLIAALQSLVAVTLPPTVIASAFSLQLLSLWLGTDFATHAARVFQWLVLGVFLNGAAHAPYALLQAHGRADVTAKLHILELPMFVALLLWSVGQWGVEGAALAWTLRVALDAALLYVAAYALLPPFRPQLAPATALILCSAAPAAAPLVTDDVHALGSLVVASCLASGLLALRLVRQWRHSPSPATQR